MKNMKRLQFLLILAIVAIAVPFASFAKGDKAKITFTDYRFDFGNVKEKGGSVSHDFTFTNTGDGNLIIIDATATCGCTKPEYPKNPIAPGKKGIIKVTYNPLGRPGPIDRTVTVKTNGSPKKVRLKIVGNVIP
ncbi:MAG: DUF1573 domain-containing protein [Prevotella sp.]|nr:DUF1573 domain-containing protein [Prevotella sp.]MCM1074582.1 DUF1573 domain-containing protein [Ruminococcus sp.]